MIYKNATLCVKNVKLPKRAEDIVYYNFYYYKGNDPLERNSTLIYNIRTEVSNYNWEVFLTDENNETKIRLSSKQNQVPENLLRYISIGGDIILSEEYIENIKDTKTKELISYIGDSMTKGAYLSEEGKKTFMNFLLSEVFQGQNFSKTIQNPVEFDETLAYDFGNRHYDFLSLGYAPLGIFPIQNRKLPYDSSFTYKLRYSYSGDTVYETNNIIFNEILNRLPEPEIEAGEEDYDEGFDDIEESVKKHRKRLRY